VPRALLFGTLTVLVLYVLLNAVFLYTTPISKLAGQLEVGLVAGQAIFGEAGGKLAAALICIGLVSSISAMMWIGPRVTMVMGEDFPMLRLFSRKSANGVPQTALLFQVAIVHVLMLTQSFEAILDFIQVSLLACSFLVVAGVIVLRATQPDLPRPYRTWGYPVTPAIFLAVTAFMMYYLFAERPGHALAGFAWMLIGFALYAVSARQTVSRTAMERSNS
jgi:APA family basic amino acid/polyamine antiporter